MNYWSESSAIIYAFSLLIQILCAVHVIRTGRSWYWLWLILFFPLIGTAVYIFIEILPDMPSYSLSGMGDRLLNFFQSGRELAVLQEKLELSDTVQNRCFLAEYYRKVGQPEKAVELYEECRQGVFKNDPVILFDLGVTLFQARQYVRTQAIFEELAATHPDYEITKRSLLYARTLQESGLEQEALKAYEASLEKASGEEARCRMAQLLEKTGQKEQALQTYQEILTRARYFSAARKKAQREWLQIAEAGIKRLSVL